MRRKALGTLIVAAAVGIGAQGLANGATSACRTVYARGTDTSSPPSKIVAHVCDRIKVVFVIGTQGQIVPDWNISRKPSKHVVKFVSKKFGAQDPSGDTASQIFNFRAVGRGRTSVKFDETTPSPGYGTLDTYTLHITVLPRRTG